ncbi:hypothetical protein D9Q98_008287 [Chlorella vulgaris]|uniref:Uncharacterized protein n=1 Tax=Chlorella vulgaris TaxID=3077 RepID=A0A9D4TGF2_CHLVU|nr:hypothetical protein D9Q98_008287 [Chlorella vulgaris]
MAFSPLFADVHDHNHNHNPSMMVFPQNDDAGFATMWGPDDGGSQSTESLLMQGYNAYAPCMAFGEEGGDILSTWSWDVPKAGLKVEEVEDTAMSPAKQGCADTSNPPALPTLKGRRWAALFEEQFTAAPSPKPAASLKFKVRLSKRLAPTTKEEEPTALPPAQSTETPTLKRAAATKAGRQGKARPATSAAKAPKGSVAKPKGRSGKSGTRQRIPGATPGRRAGGLNIPFEQLYLCHLRLLSMTKKQLAQQHGIRTDSLWEKVQAMLREVRPRLKPEGRSVISEVVTARKNKPTKAVKPRKPRHITLALDIKVLIARGVLTWPAFQAAYVTPESQLQP